MEVLQTLGKYEVRGMLGRGAMGIVYDGWDPRIERRVAIKAVRLPEHPDPETEDEIARFRREAQAAGRLTHPNIVGVYDYGETADLAYIVMEFVDGTTLKALLDRQERFALPDIDRIMQDILAGLQYSHQGGVVHRDIKPANIILTSGGRAKIADFGIARIESSSLTQVGTVMGTPAYMSPEQFMGQVVDERTDIYSSGVLLYQLLTGERPFDGSATAIMHKVLNTEPPLPSQLANTAPVALDAVVRRTMAKRPEERYPSAAAFADAITAAIAAPAEPAAVDGEATMVSAPGRPTVSERPTMAPTALPRSPDLSPGRPSDRRAMPAIAAGVLGVLVLGAGGWWFTMRPTVPTHLAASAPVSSVPTSREPAPTAVAQTSGAATQPIPTPAPKQETAPQEPPTAPQPTMASNRPPPVSPAITPAIVPAAPPAPPPATVAPVRTPETAPTASQLPAAIAPPLATVAPVRTPETAPTASQLPAAIAPPLATVAPVRTPETAPTTSQPPAAIAPPPVRPADTAPATPPGSATSQPTNERVAALALGQVRRQIDQALGEANCALVDGVVQESGTVTVTGMAGRQADDALRRQVTDLAGSRAVDWRVQRVDPVFCAALAAIRPVSAMAGARDEGLRLSLAGGKSTLRDGDLMMPRLTMAKFSGQLRVDYIMHDGSLAHLYPTVADPVQQFVAVPARTLRPGEQLEIGNPAGGRPQFAVFPPYGTDMIIAVASSGPLFDRPPTANTDDNGSEYLHKLGAAIDAARRNGASVTATVMLVDTLPKQ